MKPRGLPNAATSESGFVLIAVLWILAALAALVMVFSVYMSNSAQAIAASDVPLRSKGLVRAGLELTAYQLLSAEKDARPFQGEFRYRLGQADMSVSFVAESARIDLNHAPKELLVNFLAGLGAEPDEATNDADRIIGWRTPPKDDAATDEVSLYQAGGLAYPPRQGPFAHVNELALVLGLSGDLVDRALPFVTVYSGSPKINPLIAAPEVIAALPGMTPADLKEFLRARPSINPDKDSVATALGAAQIDAALDQCDSYRVTTTIKFDGGRTASSDVVIRLGDKKTPYRVLSWSDDVETPPRANRLARSDDDF